jgi:hypothetical protein
LDFDLGFSGKRQFRFLILDWGLELDGRRWLCHGSGLGLGWRETRAGDFEDFVHLTDEEIEFLFGEVAVGIEFLDFSGAGFGGGVAIFLEVNDFANQTGEDVQDTSVFERVFGELLLEGFGGKVSEDIIVLAGNDLEGGFGESGDIVGTEDLLSAFAVYLDKGKTFLLGEVTVIAAVFPIRDVHLGNGIREGRVVGGLEAGNDLAGGKGVVEH